MLRRLARIRFLSHKKIVRQWSTRRFWTNPEPLGTHEPFRPVLGKEPKVCSAEEAVSVVQSRHRIYVHGAAATPSLLLEALCAHAKKQNLKHVELVHIHTEGKAPQVCRFFKNQKMCVYIKDDCICVRFVDGDEMELRESHISTGTDFVPWAPVSIAPGFFLFFVLSRSCENLGRKKKGGCVERIAAILGAKHVVGLVNKNVPRTHGDGHVHLSHFDSIVYHDSPLPEIKGGGDTDEATEKIGQIIAENLIPDRACLQMGIGGIPDSVLKCLKSHKDLGIHTEMCSDGILHLVNSGIVSNAFKYQHRGKTVSSFCMGSKKLYEYIHDNPSVLFFDCSYVNDVGVISSNDRVHAINSCIEVDLTGQVCADSIGTRMFSGVGGQMDFMRGAALSRGGKPIMAFTSTTGKGMSKIVPTLKQGSGVVTTRAHVQYVVTEYGYANLYGKSLRERAKLLIGLAHPDHRESLEKAAIERFGKLDLD
ncbi:4-Hydroxybutyrate CoA-transferase [Reticulomyxa filosa]|uniref:4-Hydroxybutyrate CoA-transferase n=1 Tax=Reticulomyxa filosa TaxID=46433 RepID=X6N1A2_RETFI|nr:4-Hydroxybutyrate CoA-transferase [Reticulomyxa filosa]|eukprot:ETO19494.1 4-Hydroxybutyrate CoA-transferase [Reticulomyxa filosa]